MVDKLPVPLFIVGSGRSGTTLAASLINRFPRVHVAKETGFISRAIGLLEAVGSDRPIDELVRLTNAWLSAESWSNRASENGFVRFRQEAGLGSNAAAFVRYVWQLDSLRASSDLDVIGDNTPAYVWAIPKLESIFGDARYIHMVRDPRDVVASMMDMRFGGETAVTAALDWQANIGAWLAAERIVPAARRMELRYEDLCRNPGAELARVARFLGQEGTSAETALASQPSDADEFGAARARPHHRRLKTPLTAARIGAYRSRLTESEIAAIESITQPMMAAYGYESNDWHLSPHMEDRRLYFAASYGRDALSRAFKRLRGK